MKTAFAHWDHRIAPVFDTAKQVYIADVESDRIVSDSQALLADGLPLQRAQRLADLKVSTLICGAISRPMFGLLEAYGIQVVPFVAGDLNEVVQAWIDGRLKGDAFSMPGCCERGGRRFRLMQGKPGKEMTMNQRGQGQGRGQGGQGGQGGKTAGRMGGPLAAGPSGSCVCPQCGKEEAHVRGVPCLERKCPACGAAMVRR